MGIGIKAVEDDYTFILDEEPIRLIFEDSEGLERLYLGVDTDIKQNDLSDIINLYMTIDIPMISNEGLSTDKVANGIHENEIEGETVKGDVIEEREPIGDSLALGALTQMILSAYGSKGLQTVGTGIAMGIGYEIDIPDEVVNFIGAISLGLTLAGPWGAVIAGLGYGVYENVSYTMEHEEEIMQRNLYYTPEEYYKRSGGESWNYLSEDEKKEIVSETERYNDFYPGGSFDGGGAGGGSAKPLDALGKVALSIEQLDMLKTYTTSGTIIAQKYESGASTSSEQSLTVPENVNILYELDKPNLYSRNLFNYTHENTTSKNRLTKEDLDASTYSENKYGPQQIEYKITVPVEINTTVNEAEKFDMDQILSTIGPEVENKIYGFISTQGLRRALDR